MKNKRKNYIRIAFYSSLLLLPLYAFLIEPKWVIVKHIRLSDNPTLKIVHFSDLHYKGDKEFLDKIVRKINYINPDIVCYTGDFVEDNAFLAGALESLSKIKKPLYGVPGNHEYWHNVDFKKIEEVFIKTGGHFISSENGGTISIKNMNIYLVHYPDFADDLNAKYNLILAGHSHGGQIRIPFFGALILPYKAKKYDKGLFETKDGTLSVNPGIGTFFIPARFFCRPELTVIEL